jgi:hypothetical protein
MKGPYERLKYDLRRLWECPACHRRERTDGSIASRLCLCQTKQSGGEPVVMKLIEDGMKRVAPPVVIDHEPLPAAVEIVAPIEPADSPVAAATSQLAAATSEIESLPPAPVAAAEPTLSIDPPPNL